MQSGVLDPAMACLANDSTRLAVLPVQQRQAKQCEGEDKAEYYVEPVHS